MRAIVLAAGLGTRLRPYSDLLPKPMFPVLGVPTLAWSLAALRQAGVTDVVVNLHHLPDAITAWLGDGARLGLTAEYSREPAILGTGGAIAAAMRDRRDDGPFLVHNGDIFHDWDLSRLVSVGPLALAVTDRQDIDPSDRRVELDSSGHVTGIRGLPVSSQGRRVVFGGVSLLDRSMVTRLSAAMESTCARVQTQACLVADGLIPRLSEGEAVEAVEFPGFWYCDIGTVNSYLALNFKALGDVQGLLGRRGFEVPDEVEPGVHISRGATVGRGVRLRGPVFLADGARVDDLAVVGPDAVVSGRIARGAVVTRAVVMQGAIASSNVTGIVMKAG